MNTYKGREIKKGQRVKVYFNLHTHLFSVKDFATGLVIAHGDNILLSDVQFKVQESGRQRVLQEKQKNIHAFVIGQFQGTVENLELTPEWVSAYYNPYKVSQFMNGQEELHRASAVYLSEKKIYASV